MPWLRWWRWYLIATGLLILAATVPNAVPNFWPAALCTIPWALRAHIIYEAKRPPITDADIWAWVDGRR